jgi:hypothetical protein
VAVTDETKELEWTFTFVLVAAFATPAVALWCPNMVLFPASLAVIGFLAMSLAEYPKQS